MPSTQCSEFFVGAGMKKCRKILFDRGRKDEFLYWTLLIGLTFFLLIFISVELAFLAIDMSGQGKEWFSWVVWNRYTMGKKKKIHVKKWRCDVLRQNIQSINSQCRQKTVSFFICKCSWPFSEYGKVKKQKQSQWKDKLLCWSLFCQIATHVFAPMP